MGVLALRTIHISTNARTNMARALERFLEQHAHVKIKHTLSIRAVAAMLGFNEHSLAAAIREPGGLALVIDETSPPEIPASQIQQCDMCLSHQSQWCLATL